MLEMDIALLEGKCIHRPAHRVAAALFELTPKGIVKAGQIGRQRIEGIGKADIVQIIELGTLDRRQTVNGRGIAGLTCGMKELSCRLGNTDLIRKLFRREFLDPTAEGPPCRLDKPAALLFPLREFPKDTPQLGGGGGKGKTTVATDRTHNVFNAFIVRIAAPGIPGISIAEWMAGSLAAPGDSAVSPLGLQVITQQI